MIYVEIGQSLYSYEGMSLQTVETMLNEQNLTFTVIDEQTYQQKLASIPTGK